LEAKLKQRSDLYEDLRVFIAILFPLEEYFGHKGTMAGCFFGLDRQLEKDFDGG
jgi:hypothetical protein